MLKPAAERSKSQAIHTSISCQYIYNGQKPWRWMQAPDWSLWILWFCDCGEAQKACIRKKRLWLTEIHCQYTKNAVLVWQSPWKILILAKHEVYNKPYGKKRNKLQTPDRVIEWNEYFPEDMEWMLGGLDRWMNSNQIRSQCCHEWSRVLSRRQTKVAKYDRVLELQFENMYTDWRHPPQMGPSSLSISYTAGWHNRILDRRGSRGGVKRSRA